jgi:rod shape-determining protein MreD
VRTLISFVVTAVAVVVQLTVVDRIAFPGGAGPDLVLLVVAALALAGGPLAGALTGFWAGLALDVAPPGSHFTGQNALVFCLVGYACGLLAETSPGEGAEEGHTALFEIAVTAGGAVVGETLAALLGVMLSDPRVTWPAIRHVLPVAVAYDLLFCPFVLYAVAAALRLAGSRGEGRRSGWSASQARAARPGPNQGAIRQLAGGSSPRLRLSERDSAQRPAGGLRGPGAPRREPQLKFGRAGPRPAAAAFAAGGLAVGTSKLRFGGRRRGGVLGGPGLGASALRGPGRGSSWFGSSTMGRSLLGGSVFSRSSVPLGATTRFGRSSLFRRSGNAIRGAGGGLAGPSFRLSRGRSTGRLGGALRRPAVPKSPGRGWLRGTSARGGRSLGGSALRGGSLSGSALRGRTRGGRSLGRSLRGSGRALGGNSLRGSGGGSGIGRALGGRSARARLRMPRPKVKRKRRTGGYR